MMMTAGAHSSQPEPSLGPGALGQRRLAAIGAGGGVGAATSLGAVVVTRSRDESLRVERVVSWFAIVCSVFCGSMSAGGDTAWEITIDMFW